MEKTNKRSLRSLTSTIVPVGILVIIVVFFQIISSGRLLTTGNIRSIFNNMFSIAIGAAGVSFLMAQGNLDFSLDGIFIAAGTLTYGILPALTTLLDEYDRTDVKITMIDFPEGMEEAFETGYMLSACGGFNVTDAMFCASLVVNYLQGTPLSEEPVSIRVNQMYLESVEDVENYFKYCESGVSTYTAEELNEYFFKFVNPEVTVESVTELAANYSLDDVVSRHQDIVE